LPCGSSLAQWRRHSLDPLAADGLVLGMQFGVDARCPVSAPVLHVNPPDIAWQFTLGCRFFVSSG
jgi:hypothetical protein